jgi:hypothetical protein
LQKEIRTVALTTLYFAVWFSLVAVLKTILLEEYRIEFRGMSLALIGALIVAKVVLVLEYVPLGSWVGKRAALLDVVLRTLLYTCGVAIVLLLERAFETRHEHGGFIRAVVLVFEDRDVHHVWFNTICVACALLLFNALAVLRRYVGEERLYPLFLAPLPDEPTSRRPAAGASSARTQL